MSDMCMYELEDIIWDDLYQSDDHILIHPGDEQADQHSFGCNNRKRPVRESVLEGDAGGSSSEDHTIQDRADQIKHIEQPTRKMLGKQAADNHLGNSNSINEATTLESDSIKMSDNSFLDTLPPGGELSGKESILSEKTVAVGDSVGFQHLFPEADNILSFFDNSGGKDSSDLSCYSLDDMDIFEDVDRMLRSCDSTFVLGTSQEDDLGWLSSSDAVGESEHVFNSNDKFSCPDCSSQKSMSEREDTLRSNGMTCSINQSEDQNSSAIFKGYGQHGILSFSSGTCDSSVMENKDNVIPNGQTDEQIKQMKLPNKPESRKKFENVGHTAFLYAADLPGAGLSQIEAPDSHSVGYLHSDTTSMSSNYSLPSEENSLHPARSAIKSENSCPAFVSPKDSCTLDHMQPMYSVSQASSLQGISCAEDEKGELINRLKNNHSSSNDIPKNMGIGAQASKSATIPTEKPTYYSGNSRSDGVNIKIHQGSGFSVARDTSVSSGLDNMSIEATSFHQLQLVMEQLDSRTKLCIRDSLYRLARSAEQRHQYVELNGGPSCDKGSMLAEGTTKFPDFMDLETDTNPIDRSIAHLLFHRPADAPVVSSPTPRLVSSDK